MITLLPNKEKLWAKYFYIKTRIFCLEKHSWATFRATMCYAWYMCHVLMTTEVRRITLAFRMYTSNMPQ